MNITRWDPITRRESLREIDDMVRRYSPFFGRDPIMKAGASRARIRYA